MQRYTRALMLRQTAVHTAVFKYAQIIVLEYRSKELKLRDGDPLRPDLITAYVRNLRKTSQPKKSHKEQFKNNRTKRTIEYIGMLKAVKQRRAPCGLEHFRVVCAPCFLDSYHVVERLSRVQYLF